MDKYYVKKKDVFDINKVTVVGSPTITSDGVASGFSSSNYVTLPVSFFPTALSFLVIEGEVLTNNLNTVNQAVFGALQQGSTLAFLGIRLTQAGGQFLYSTGVNLQKAITFTKNLTNNTFYRYKVEINKSDIKLYLNNEIVFEASDFVYVQPRQFNIGINRSLGDVFNGSIDLTQLSITVDGELVYSPTKPTYLLERRKEGFDLSKFTVVGSPTITEYGVASGLNDSNYIQATTIDYSKNWEIVVPFKTGSTISAQVLLTLNTGTTFASNYLVLTGAKSLSFRIKSLANIDSFVLTENTDYIAKIGWDGSRYYLKISGQEYYRNSSTALEIDEPIKLGTISNSGWIFQGTINLSQFSITVDGEEVFTGAEEKFYILRGDE